MSCQATRDAFLNACVSGGPTREEARLHARECPACLEETRRLVDTWAALGRLPLLEPSARVSRRLQRRLRWAMARDVLGSIASWKRAALTGVGGFALSFILSLLLPYELMLTLCRAVAPEKISAVPAYLAAGFIYGLLPMAMVMSLQRGRVGAPAGVVGVLEASVVFLVAVVPYVVAACGFPPPLLIGFVGGLALGALGGGAAAMGLRRRIVWT